MEGNVKLMKPKTLHLPLFHCGVHLPFPVKYQANQEIPVNDTRVTSRLISTKRGRETVPIWHQQSPHHVHVAVYLVKLFR